jgi:hypothetical protein
MPAIALLIHDVAWLQHGLGGFLISSIRLEEHMKYENGQKANQTSASREGEQE